MFPKATERQYLTQTYVCQYTFRLQVLKCNYLSWLNHSIFLFSLALAIISTKYHESIIASESSFKINKIILVCHLGNSVD